MARRKFTVDRYQEIERRLAEGRSLREIAHALGCSRRTVRQVRDGQKGSPELAARRAADPLWMGQLDWPAPASAQGTMRSELYASELSQYVTTDAQQAD